MDKLKDKAFWEAAGIRAIRTAAQTAIASIGAAATIEQVGWLTVISTVALSSALSVLTSIVTGLPEVEP